MTVDFEWDEAKAIANQRKHGVSFSSAAKVFLDSQRLDGLDNRRDYGEDRWLAVGLVEGSELTVVTTPRGESVRIL